jgi:predicted short-subunit dehydrogenase-like oxidoreductase (DUF2520 family)
MRIVIIGTGNTATVLGKLFRQAGHTIVQVFGRTSQHAEHLGGVLHSGFTSDEKQLVKEADLYIIAVSDNAISDIVSWLHLNKKLVVHTAGSVDAGILSTCSKNYGVLYPLQSLRKEMGQIPEIPFLIEGNTGDNGALIYDFAGSISKHVQFANGQQRLMIHIAAIMVSNFTNHLYMLAEDFCNKEHIDFKMLLPLISETAGRLNKFSPSEVQTGPAVRDDTNTIQKHMQLLDAYPFHQSIYHFLTDRIQEWKNVATNSSVQER